MTEEQFYDLQPLAVFGVSSRAKGFGVSAYKELVKSGVKCYAVNPRGGMVEDQKIYPSLREVPEPVRAAVILTKGDGAVAAVEECAREGVQWVWLQGGSNTEEVRKLCDDLELKKICGTCILLRKGGFPHSIHRFLHDLFSRKDKHP